MLFSRYWNTIRHLKLIQIYGRIWFKCYKPRPNLTEAPALRNYDGMWCAPACREPSMLGPYRFRFLNIEYELIHSHFWNDQSFEKLWLYHLHYFDDLNARGAEARLDWHKRILAQWVRDNPPFLGIGWEPYPTAVRIVNWIKWALLGNTLSMENLHSLAIQTRWLLRRLEFHLLGNHLFIDAKALVFSGLFFRGTEAEQWLERGMNILTQEIPKQILSDGGQFERSTMYHALALEDMLDLYNLVVTFQNVIPKWWFVKIEGWLETIGCMRHWLSVMCHPDGEISFFNDAAMGIAPSPAELDHYAKRLGLPLLPEIYDGIVLLKESGYVRVQQGAMVALLDVAPLGPDYLLGHGHADTLSFELSLFGQRVLVNSGTSCYGESEKRLRERGTAAHNTVVINGRDSSEVWGGFRVARRAYPFLLDVQREGQKISVEASHDGYQRLPGKNNHIRHWVIERGAMVVIDKVIGHFESAKAYFHLHPNVIGDAQVLNDGQAIFLLKDGHRVEFIVEGGKLHFEASDWHPQFGKSISTICLVVNLYTSRLRTLIKWDET